VRGIGEVRKLDGLVAGCVTLICCLLLGCAAPRSSPTTTGNEPSAHRNTTLLPSTEADIRGTITEVQRIPQEPKGHGEVERSAPDTPVSSDDARRGDLGRATGDESAAAPIGVVLVEENPDEETGSQKDSVTVTKATRLFERQGGDLARIRFDDLKAGQRARAWYTGPVAESYPRQATASLIVVYPPAE